MIFTKQEMIRARAVTDVRGSAMVRMRHSTLDAFGVDCAEYAIKMRCNAGSKP
jgi:hypothetical protein